MIDKREQHREIVSIARRALALLNPSWSITKQLRKRLNIACAPALSSRPTRPLNQPDIGDQELRSVGHNGNHLGQQASNGGLTRSSRR
jgi:hypothetical protein